MYFTEIELLNHCNDREKTEVRTSPRYTLNMARMIIALNAVRSALRLPLMVNSFYRSATHNREVGGSSTSQHLCAAAADIRCSDLKALLNAIQDVQEVWGYFGQVIVYKTFIHVGLHADGVRELPFSINIK